jgi:hypothetical protein
LVNRDFNRDRERKAAASHASAVRDLFPLDRRVFAARLIEARFHALEGRFDDALEAMATIQRAGLEPETRLSKHLAALVWIHRSLTSDSLLAFEPAWIRNGESGPINDLALSPRGDLVIAGATGATHFSPDDGRIRQLDPARSRVACHSARVSVLGSVYLNCDDGFFINGLRKELTGMPGDSEAERWARDLSKADARLVGVDGEANCAFLDQREGVPIVRGCRRVGPEPGNLFSPKTYAIRDLAGAGVLLPAPAAVAIERRIQNGAMILWTNPRSGPPSISVAKDARAVLDVEPDPLGWIVILYEERTGHSLLIWDPKDGREVVRTPISRTAGKEQPSSVLPDGAGGVWVGYRNGALRHFLWSTTP